MHGRRESAYITYVRRRVSVCVWEESKVECMCEQVLV